MPDKSILKKLANPKVGMYISKNKVKLFDIKNRYIFLAVVLLGFISLFISRRNGRVAIAIGNYGNNILMFVAGAVSGSFFIMLIGIMIDRIKTSIVFNRLGKETIGVIFHGYEYILMFLLISILSSYTASINTFIWLGILIGYIEHMILDLIGNDCSIKGYSLIYRILVHFDINCICVINHFKIQTSLEKK